MKHEWMFEDDDYFVCKNCGGTADFDRATSNVDDCPACEHGTKDALECSACMYAANE